MAPLIFLAVALPIVGLLIVCSRALTGQFLEARTLSRTGNRSLRDR